MSEHLVRLWPVKQTQELRILQVILSRHRTYISKCSSNTGFCFSAFSLKIQL